MGAVTWLQILAGLGCLAAGAQGLVRGSSGLARRLGISPLVIGLTVVALGTSSPEVTVSVVSAVRGQTDLAVGNVVGSNILNVLFVLGLSALITPLVVARQLVRRDVPLMAGLSLLMGALAWNGRIGRLEGCALLAGLVAYIVFLVRFAWRQDGEPAAAPPVAAPTASPALVWLIVMVAAGLGLLILGSRMLVDGAIIIARAYGLSELIIGLTIVAVGTSLPEVASSLVAAFRRESDLAVGNVVGSNLFNLLGVLGAAALPQRGGLPVPPSALSFDLPVMIAVAVACLPIFFTGHRISRWEGALFLAYYVAYVLFLVLNATGYHALPLYSSVMLAFVLPLTIVTLTVVTVRAWRHRGRPPRPTPA